MFDRLLLWIGFAHIFTSNLLACFSNITYLCEIEINIEGWCHIKAMISKNDLT